MAQAGGPVASPVTMQNGHDEIAHSCHRVRGGAGPNTAGILAQADVSYVMQLVLDRPMHATEAEQVRWSGALRWQAGDFVMHLRVPTHVSLRLMDESTDLC